VIREASGTLENAFVRRFWLKTVRHFLDLIIIDAGRKERMNGNRLKHYVHDKYAVAISSDAMYHRLARLEKEGLIILDTEMRSDASAKFYVTTKKGVDLLNGLFAYREETKTFLEALLAQEACL
jgi:DNA-binding PadR family transcriptional regulator